MSFSSETELSVSELELLESSSSLSQSDSCSESSPLIDSESETDTVSSCSSNLHSTELELLDSELELLDSNSDDDSPEEAASTDTQGDDVPLYAGAIVTRFQALILIMQFALRFQLTDAALTELLKLIHTLIPKPNCCLKSVYTLRKFFAGMFSHIQTERHRFCTYCHSLLKQVNDGAYHFCHGEDNVGEFVTANVETQLKEKFKDPDFWNLLRQRSTTTTSHGISDIYDGTEYSKHTKAGGFLCPETSPANLSFCLNTDGVALFKSSHANIWPLFLVINELPSPKRFLKKNVLLCGLWYGEDKPSNSAIHTFLTPLITFLNRMYQEGIKVETPDGFFISRGMLLLTTVDLPARAILCNMKQHSGAHACCTCEDLGDNTLGKTRLHRVWPFTASCKIRTPESVANAFRSATNTGKAILGYKGVPILAIHPPFNVVNGVVTDYLHCVLLGVTKSLIESWFGKSNHGKDFYIGKKFYDLQLGLCDKRLKQIEVPDTIKRPPRSLSDYAHWKGTEFQAWLLWYSLPVLEGVLPNPYYNHYSKLVAGIALLLEDSLTLQEVERAQGLLDEFYKPIMDLYGFDSARMNVHLLRHMTFHVQNWGPLWGYSCFTFESLNGDLKKYFHGTRNMSERMLFTYTLSQCLPEMAKKVLDSKTAGKRLGNRTAQYSKTMWRIGGFIPISMERDLLQTASSHAGFIPDATQKKFFRLEMLGTLLYSKEYSRTQKTNSYTVVFHERHLQKFAVIQCFIELSNSQQRSIWAQVNELVTTDMVCGNTLMPHLYCIQTMHSSRLIPVSWIFSKCLYIEQNEKSFVAKPLHDFCIDLSS